MIENTDNKIVYTGNGSLSQYNFDFPIEDESELILTKTVIASGAETLLVLGVDYTVTLDGPAPNTGHINLLAGNLPSTDQLSILGEVEITQERQLEEGDDLPVEELERALDKLTRIAQQLAEKLGRSVILPVNVSGPITMPNPALNDGKFLTVAGGALAFGTPTAVNYSGAIGFGLLANRPASPQPKDMYFATDNKRFYFCFTVGVWAEFAIDGANITGLANLVSGAGRIPRANLPLVFEETEVALTDAGSIATDASLGKMFKVTLGGNRTLSNPTNPPAVRQARIWCIRQDATGSRTLALDTKFRISSTVGTSITLSTGANKEDFIGAIYNPTDDKWEIVAFAKAA